VKWTPKTGQPNKLLSGSPGKGITMAGKRKTHSAVNADQEVQRRADQEVQRSGLG
jgi:hypothetical protein